MKKIGLFYSFKSIKTAKIAEKILAELKDNVVESVNAETVTEEQFLSYDNLILGVPTWFDGELPTYWDEFGPSLEDLNLKGKQIALYGLGDQVGYPESFLDAVGIMAELLESCGAKIVGLTPTKGFKYEKSKAVRGDNFLGLAIDFENQSSKNKERVNVWIEKLKKEFK
jgi:flavodoxin I